MTTTIRIGTLRRLIAIALLGAAACAFGQDLNAIAQQQLNQTTRMLEQSMRQSQQLSQTMQQTQQQLLQQRMQDPAVRSSYQQYLQQMQGSGRQPMDFATYTYYHIYTNGFSRGGIEHMNRVEGGNRAAEMNAWQGVRQAEQNRADSMQAQRDGYFHNQQEAGRGLMGQSTYQGPNGSSTQLPHTWQRNSTHNHLGQTYHVDHSGQYYVRGTDGWWYPINR